MELPKEFKGERKVSEYINVRRKEAMHSYNIQLERKGVLSDV